MTHNRDGPDIGFYRIGASTRGDPDIGRNNRSRAPSIAFIFNTLTGSCLLERGNNALPEDGWSKGEFKKSMKNWEGSTCSVELQGILRSDANFLVVDAISALRIWQKCLTETKKYENLCITGTHQKQV